jgi:hypothetical protein
MLEGSKGPANRTEMQGSQPSLDISPIRTAIKAAEATTPVTADLQTIVRIMFLVLVPYIKFVF